MSTKNDDKPNLESKTISELLEIATQTQRILQQKQDAIRDNAVVEIERIAQEAGIKVWIRIPKKRDGQSGKLYRNPDDHSQTYSGKGKSPKWLNDKIAAGANKEDFLVTVEPAAA